jgi:hypothetical protein
MEVLQSRHYCSGNRNVTSRFSLRTKIVLATYGLSHKSKNTACSYWCTETFLMRKGIGSSYVFWKNAFFFTNVTDRWIGDFSSRFDRSTVEMWVYEGLVGGHSVTRDTTMQDAGMPLLAASTAAPKETRFLIACNHKATCPRKLIFRSLGRERWKRKAVNAMYPWLPCLQ